MNFFSNSFYKELKEATAENFFKSAIHFDELLQFDASMFEYDNVPEDMAEYWELFELWLCTHPGVAIGKLEGKLVFAFGGLGGGHLNDYGFMDHFIGATMNGTGIKWEIGKDCIVIWNNFAKTPDRDLLTTAELLGEIDTSIDDNILYSRFYPVPLAEDQRTKEQIKEIFKNLKEGGKKTSVIDKKKDVASLVGGNQADQIPVLNLTDVKNSDKIQYLSHLHDDVMRWFTTKYGQAVQGTGKQAQQSIEEIDGNTSVSFAYPLIKFMCRKKGMDAVNALFGTNIRVRFSPIWAVEFNKFVTEATATDELEEVEEETGADNPEEMPEGTAETPSEEPKDKEKEEDKDEPEK